MPTDTERLDWLETCKKSWIRIDIGADETFAIQHYDGERLLTVDGGATIRGAIDAAMIAGKRGVSEQQ